MPATHAAQFHAVSKSGCIDSINDYSLIGTAMKFVLTAIITLFIGITLATDASAQVSIDDQQAWLTKVVTQIKSGDLANLENTIKTSLDDTKHENIDALSDLFTTVMTNRKPYHVTKLDEAIIIDDENMWLAFGHQVYAAYYSEREIVFFAFNFATHENGWQLDSFDYVYGPVPYKVAELF